MQRRKQFVPLNLCGTLTPSLFLTKFISLSLVSVQNKHPYESYHPRLLQPTQGGRHFLCVMLLRAHFRVRGTEMSTSVFIWTNPSMKTSMGKSPKDTLAKSIVKLGKMQRRKTSRASKLLHEKRDQIYKEKR